MDNIVKYTQQKACEELNITRPTLYKRCKKLNIDIRKIGYFELDCLKKNIEVINEVTHEVKKPKKKVKKPKKDNTNNKKLESTVKNALSLGIDPLVQIKKDEKINIKQVQDNLIREVTGRYSKNAIKIQQMSDFLETCHEIHGCYSIENRSGVLVENPEMKSYINLMTQQDKLARLMTEVLQIQPPEEDDAPEIIF